ncbi:MAG TPA: glycosyltransferase, partial [Chitinophagaceae bacterium]|nr:glycosyltransferase [Chitinophagaceae bacterium]
MKTRFLTIFPEAENVHLIKDVGMVPYSLHRYCAYTAGLACYKQGEYPYLHTEVKGLQLVFIRKIFSNTLLDGLWLIASKSRKYDIVQTFHFRLRSLLWLFAFKLLRPTGKTFLKLDANERILDQDFKGLKGRLKAFLLRRVDLVSVENTYLQKELSRKWQRPIAYLPNGFSETGEPVPPYAEKKNQLLSVGRIGAAEKRTEVLLEAFALFSEHYPEWTLKLVGPVESLFSAYLDTYFRQYPQLADRILFTGAIQDRKELYRQYGEAKIFCLSSLWESFGIVLVEAAAAGCYLLTSAVLA